MRGSSAETGLLPLEIRIGEQRRVRSSEWETPVNNSAVTQAQKAQLHQRHVVCTPMQSWLRYFSRVQERPLLPRKQYLCGHDMTVHLQR